MEREEPPKREAAMEGCNLCWNALLLTAEDNKIDDAMIASFPSMIAQFRDRYLLRVRKQFCNCLMLR